MLPALPERWREEDVAVAVDPEVLFPSCPSLLEAPSLMSVAPVFKGDQDFLHFYLSDRASWWLRG